MMTVELLYPEIANLYGELGNIEYLQRSVPACDVRRTGLEDRPAFLDGGVDLVCMGSMTERAQSVAAARLAPFREEIRRAVEEGQAFLITGNAMELFGTGIDDTDGTHVDGLGLFPFHTTRDMLGRYNSLYLGKYGDTDIVGYKSQFTQSFPDGPIPPLFETVRGPGMNRQTGPEGIRYKNFMATYLLGPLLVLNPPFLVHLVESLTGNTPFPAFEQAAMAAYWARVAEYSNPRRGFTY
jgi:CobQ-like glutamine amidotransferase family enzyme